MSLKEEFRKNNPEDPRVTRAKDLAFIYGNAASEQMEKYFELINSADWDELKLAQYIIDTRKQTTEKRLQATKIEAAKDRNALVASVAEGTALRLAYGDPMVQGIGKLGLAVLELLQTERDKIPTFASQANSADLGFFYHPALPIEINILTSQNNDSRFVIGPGGSIGFTHFAEQSSDSQVYATVLHGGVESHDVSTREFRIDQKSGIATPHYSQYSAYNKIAAFDLLKTNPKDLPNMLGEQYDVLNEAVQQMVIDSS